MKRFLCKLAVFLLILLGVLCAFEVGFRTKSSTFKDKYEGLSRFAPEIEILALGHSHANEGFNPKVFSHRAYNMAIGFQNVYFDDYILNHFIDRMDSLKCVVIATSYYHFFNEIPDLDKLRGEDLFNTVKYHLYWNADCVKDERIPVLSPKYNLEIFNNPATAYFSMARYYLSGQHWKKSAREAREEFLQYGYSNGFDITTNAAFLDSDGERTARAHNPSGGFINNGLPYNYFRYEDIVKCCAAHSVNVALVLYPCWHTYVDNLDAEQMAATRWLMSKLASDNPNCVALDYISDNRFGEGDFHDAIHLNSAGAQKISLILDAELTAIGWSGNSGDTNSQ